MATSFPTSKDILINPDGLDSVKEVSHSAQHANANDAIVALETKVGVNNSTDVNSLDYKVKQLELNFQDENEIKDLAASIITGGSHTGISVSYNNTTNLLSLSATYDDDEVVSAVAQALTAGNGISKSFNDTTNVITIQVDTTVIADKTYVNTAISNLVDGAPALLDTLNEIAAAIGDDANFVTTITTALATKAPLISPALTGIPTAPTAEADTSTTQIATTAFAKAEADAAQAAAATDATTKVAAEAALRVTGDAASVTTAAQDATDKVAAEAALRVSGDAASVSTAATDATTKVAAEAALRVTGDAASVTTAAQDATDKVAAEAALRVTGDATSVSTAAADATAKVAAEAALRITGDETSVSTAATDATTKVAAEAALRISGDAASVSTAASDATTKANAAQAAAEATASTDATTKVAAEAALRISGDAASVATAAADATEKANAARTAAELTATNTFVPIAGFTELAQDSVSSLLAHSGHTNVTATYDDVANKINLAVTAQLTQEEAQDYIAPLFVHGLNPNINASYDDIANKLILEAVIPPSTAIVSASAPANPINGQFWFDSDEFRTGSTRALKVWQSSTSSWQYVASDLSLSTTNTWTSDNTFTNGIVIGLNANPPTAVHGQIYYNKLSDKLKVFASGLWQDVQVGEGGGGLSLISTDNTLPPTTFFVGLVAPPAQSTSNGDLWIDVDDIDTPFNQFYTGGVSPDPAQYEFWVDNVEPIQELIYSADEPGTPSYPGELWIDTDEFDGAIVEFGATAPNPNNVQLWVDINENESPSYYDQLTFTNYATVANFPQNAPNGFVASDASTGLAYVRSQGQWLAIVTASNINNIISSNSTVFEDLKALAWMGFE
jgi:spore coat polysaccharide biosynthesis protein SpsF (cytidylyltransferase family)